MPRLRRKTVLKTLKKNRLPILLVLAGGLLILFPSLYSASQIKLPNLPRPNYKVVGIEKVKESNKPKGPFKIESSLLSNSEPTQPPQRILIPKYKLDLNIVEANVVDGFWEISEVSASHGVGSANPGENGNIVVFAHARDGLFGPIRNIQKGEDIYLLTKDRWHKFRVTETKLVNPDQIEVVSQTNKETLTLFTCSGFLDSKRLIVRAIPT